MVKKNVINIFESQYSCCEVVELQINSSLFAPFEGVRIGSELASALLCEDLFSSGVFKKNFMTRHATEDRLTDWNTKSSKCCISVSAIN